ncbi:hypothetical protein OJF2_39360 [Aquisphaera giovannonii]|uniref:Uncharacterized protein n=1 Tax=Aquisphaera giovannonii TaxID=406548 RepID=A0A5B9W5B9_9BACT|nr:hypothetical protein OJF2_39360 [Aquisphaera giovannonii]
MDRLKQFFACRHFAEFRARIRSRTSFQAALVELFLQGRIRSYVLAYLSVQEGEDFEGADGYDTHIPLFISQLLRNLGRVSLCSLNLPLWKLNVHIDIDPLVNLRSLYSLLLFGHRGRKTSLVTRAGIAWQRLVFQLKAKLVSAVMRMTLWRTIGRRQNDGFIRLLRFPGVRRLLAVAILVLFPSAHELTEPEWLSLLNRIEDYFVRRLNDLTAALPEQSLSNHGVIKLVKVAFGTIVGRVSVRDAHEANNSEFIFNTFRIAYCWGITYPLVDNVLDSSSTVQAVREQLTLALTNIFNSEKSTACSGLADEGCDPGVREVSERLREALSLVPSARLKAARSLLGNLLESHRRDSRRRISTIGLSTEESVRSEVMIDTALKSALVRLATMELCGIEVEELTISGCLVRSLFNQLGDDLWDIYEDADDDRVTPYTLFLLNGGGGNPFDFYFRYTAFMTDGFSRRRRTAALMGFCETLRDSLLSLRDRPEDSLDVAGNIAGLIERAKQQSASNFVQEVPHVDFDAVLFAFEKAMLELLPS